MPVATQDFSASGSISSISQTLMLDMGASQSNWIIQTAGTFVGTLIIEQTVDGTNWQAFNYRQTGSGRIANTITAAGVFRGNAAGCLALRVRSTAWTSGAASVTLRASAGVGPIFHNAFTPTQSLGQYYASTAGGNVAYNATSGIVNAATLTNILIIENPISSNVDLYMAKFVMSASAAGPFARLRNGTRTGGTLATAVNRGGGANAAAAAVYIAPFTGITGGVTGKTEYVSANTTNIDTIEGGIILRPGQSLHWTFNGPGGATATVEVVWWEVGLLT